MLDNIAATGYKPEDVDTILLTHMPPDHIGGITNEKAEALFPNATAWAHKDDADVWLNNDLAATLAEDQRPFFILTQDAAAPYIASGLFKTFVSGDDLIPGLVSIVEASGHTAFMMRSAGEKCCSGEICLTCHLFRCRTRGQRLNWTYILTWR